MRSIALKLLALTPLAATACEDEPTAVDRFRERAAQARPSGSAPSMTFVSGVPTVSAAPSRPATLEVHELEAADERFKGWTVKAPADAEVQADLDGARIRTVDSARFDLGIKLGPSDLARFRVRLLAGAATTRSQVALTEDTKTSLAWTTQVGNLTLYGFRTHLTVRGEPLLCYTVTELESEADLKAHRDACASIAKR